MSLDASVFEDDVFDDVESDLRSSKSLGGFVPVVGEWGSYGEYRLVGHGIVTSDMCGRWLCFKGCIRTDLHDHISLSGENFKGKIFVRVIHHSCDKPSCPVCFKSGWAVRQAGKIEGRLAEASKRFGQVEHIVATVPPKFYGLDYDTLRSKVVKVLFDRGIVGGVLIFHGFRYNLRHSWYWSPHFHVLGYIIGGYGRCRGCKKCVKGCGGFVDRSYRCFERDGCVVRVLGKRKTVFGTAWYQLNHATIKPDVRRFHVATWFGNCSYRKLKVTVEKRKDLCPICSEELVKLHYLGARRIVKVKDEQGYVGSFVDDLVDGDGLVTWCEASSGSYI
jgi:hypothetical protein